MYAQVEKPKEKKSRAIANSVTKNESNKIQRFGLVDNREKQAGQVNTSSIVSTTPDTIQRVVMFSVNTENHTIEKAMYQRETGLQWLGTNSEGRHATADVVMSKALLQINGKTLQDAATHLLELANEYMGLPGAQSKVINSLTAAARDQYYIAWDAVVKRYVTLTEERDQFMTALDIENNEEQIQARGYVLQNTLINFTRDIELYRNLIPGTQQGGVNVQAGAGEGTWTGNMVKLNEYAGERDEDVAPEQRQRAARVYWNLFDFASLGSDGIDAGNYNDEGMGQAADVRQWAVPEKQGGMTPLQWENHKQAVKDKWTADLIATHVKQMQLSFEYIPFMQEQLRGELVLRLSNDVPTEIQKEVVPANNEIWPGQTERKWQAKSSIELNQNARNRVLALYDVLV